MDFGNLLKLSWDKLSKNLANWIIFCLIAMVLTLTIVLVPTVVRGLVKETLAFLRQGKEPEYTALWDFEDYLQWLLLILVAGGLITLGSIVIIPGVILSVWWMYSVFFMFDQKLEFWPAMAASREAVSKSGFWTHFIMLLIINVLNSAGGALCGLGVLITMPLGLFLMAYAYLELIGEKPAS
jgi:hypothetical protein